MSERDLIQRGVYGSSPLVKATFVGLRMLDGFVLQRALQLLDPIPALFARLGWSVPPPPPSGGAPLTTLSPATVGGHNLTPFQAVIWTMSMTAALKHSYWMLFICKEQIPLSATLIICIFNTLINGIGTLAFSLASVNPTWSDRLLLYVSIPLFATGILVETVSEIQRAQFKDDPRNKGKPFSGGLFAYARSINYFGYNLWRTAMGLATGGLIWGGFVSAFFSYDFITRAIPTMDEYCSKRYGAQWTALKRKVPYMYFPGVY